MKRNLMGLLVIALLIVGLAACKGAESVNTPQPEPDDEVGVPLEADDPEPLTFTLSEGTEGGEVYLPANYTPGDPLSDEELASILDRLPTLVQGADDTTDFNLPDEVIPPPRPGETVDEPFPYDGGSAALDVEYGALEVLRYSPEGEIPIAPFVNITFNQPMVPLGTLSQLSDVDVPAQVSPPIPGTWRWLGTKTLNFQADSELVDRLPMATEYEVYIPAGTESAVGGVLAEAVTFTFNTPAPRLQNYYPYGDPQPLEPIFFISFDQRVDPEAVLEHLTVTADGKQVDVKLATEDEIAEDETVNGMVENAQEGRWLAFRAYEPLSADADINVIVEAGTPSAEGPLLTTSGQSYNFYTYAPLKLTDSRCGWDDCRPLMPFTLEFNNQINMDAFDESMITVSPEIAGMTINVSWNTISISGMTEGQTTYKVGVSGEIKDIFGQTLGRDEQVRFKVGSAEPFLVGPQDRFITLDPSAQKPSISYYVMNYSKLDVQVYAVQPTDWAQYLQYLDEYQWTDEPIELPGEKLVDETRNVDTKNNVLTEITLDLREYVKGDFGHYIVVVKPHQSLFAKDNYWETNHVWAQITQIGVDAFVDHSEMMVWTTKLADGSPLANVDVYSNSGAKLGTAGEDGVAKFAIPAGGASYLTAQLGDDVAMLPNNTYYWDESGWSKRSIYDELRWFVYDDRAMYRPGEEVHIKGFIRQIGGGQMGDVGLTDGLTGVNWTLTGPQGNQLANGRTDTSMLGGFDFVIELPESVNLGYASLQLYSEGGVGNVIDNSYYHAFQIQEFRRPEFEVTARNETAAPYFVGEHAVLAVEAKYYAGGALPGAETNWWVSSNETNYSPPNWDDFTFGFWTPWWYFYEGDGEWEEPQSESFSGFTDATGTHYLRVDFNGETTRPTSITAEATVMDLNRQAWTSGTSLLVHPADVYVGLRSERYFVERGEPLEIELIVTDIDGNVVSGRPVSVEASRIVWKSSGGWHEELVDPQTCEITSGEEAQTCTFDTSVGGRYRITALVTDEQGRQNESRLTRWVSGGEIPPSRTVEQEEITLIPDKDEYQPGDTAEILVQTPFTPAEVLVTVSRSGILYTERHTIEEGTLTLTVPITDAQIPNINVQVDAVGSAPRLTDAGVALDGVPARPAYATANLNLSIPPYSRTLEVAATLADDEIEPGGTTSLALELKDANGNPVADAELAVVVVDESILALSNYQLADPISTFYTQRSADLSAVYGRANIVLANPEVLAEAARNAENQVMATQSADDSFKLFGGEVMEEAAMEAPMAAEMEMADGIGGGGAPAPQIAVRSDFNPLATFEAEVRTDADGKATVEINVPDNLTRYRVMVVAVDAGGQQFGKVESSLTARLPLMVRPSAPRFLNFGDKFDFPILLQNQTDEDIVVDVALEATNITLPEGAGQRVTVPANDRVEVRFAAETEMAGIAQFQIGAVSGSFADAATVELPVYTPATTAAFATYGVVDSGAVAQPIARPEDVYAQFGGLEIQTSSTALQALTDAVMYLNNYPYECTEQISSRVLGIASLRDVLTAFQAEGLPSASEMEASVNRDLTRLASMQNYDGGFPYWRRGQESIPFNTIHVAHALARAQEKGFDVPAEMQTNLQSYLQNIESYYPYWYSQYTRRVLSAYALYVRDLLGDSDPAKARALYAEAPLDDFSFEAIGWMWQVLVDDPNSATQLEEIRRYVNNHAVETAGAANFTTSYDDQTYLILSSNRRADAVLLDALMADNPDADLIPKLVNGLLAHRTQGRWGSTQENVFVLLALDRYFNTYEAQTPDFVARIWLGETYAGEHAYAGYTTDRHETSIPMSYLVDGADLQDLILSKDGVGRLYYRLGLKYAPTDLNLEPLDMGFVVTRSYEAVDDPEDVWQDDDGVWHVKAGARVRVSLKMVADNRRYHVALVDPLPAGLEIVNPDLAVSSNAGISDENQNPFEMMYGWWWWRTWYEHENLRDERAEAFTSLLWDGVYDYSYIARATTPGTFIAPPAKAEEMYSPEVFGRSGSDWVVVEAD